MTDKQQALRDLLAKVIAWRLGSSFPDKGVMGVGSAKRLRNVFAAYSGSKDAAFELCNSMLPDYVLQIDTLGNAWVYVANKYAPPLADVRYTIKGDPARAALICILKALIAKGEA